MRNDDKKIKVKFVLFYDIIGIDDIFWNKKE